MNFFKNIYATIAVASLASLAGAQYASSTIANNFIDISGSGADLGIIDDDGGLQAPIGFSFEYFGTAITEIGVSSNGYLSVGGALGDFGPDCIPSVAAEADRISPFQFDYSPNIAGTIYSETAGVAGSQTFTIQWDGVPTFISGGGDSSFTFQAVLSEADNSIEFHYGTLDGGLVQMAPVDGSEQVIGIEGAGGTVGFQISCEAAIPGGEGYRFEIPSVVPANHGAPASACIGGSVSISGNGEPGHFYGIAVSGRAGPSAFLPGCDLDLGLDYLSNIIGLGMIDATGSTATHDVLVPASAPCGTSAFSQMVSLTLRPAANVQKSTSLETTFNSCQTLLGSGDLDDTTADFYSFAGTAGEVITITLCRIGTEVDGSSLLDPRVCVYDSAAVIPGAGLGTIQNDDTLGDCFVTGPFGASIIEDWTIPATDTYTIAASNWAGSEGPYELGVTGCTGTVTLAGDEVVGGCFN